MAGDDTARINVTSIHQAEIGELRERFGVTTAWFGFSTRRWWAVDGDLLVEASTPRDLGEEIMSARRRDNDSRDPGQSAAARVAGGAVRPGPSPGPPVAPSLSSAVPHRARKRPRARPGQTAR